MLVSLDQSVKSHRSLLTDLAKCGIIERALQLSSVKDMTDMKKSDGKKRNRITGIPKLDDAIWLEQRILKSVL